MFKIIGFFIGFCLKLKVFPKYQVQSKVPQMIKNVKSVFFNFIIALPKNPEKC